MNKWLKRFALVAGKERNEEGVTLIELLAVVVILGILASIAVPVVSSAITQAKVNQTVTSEGVLQGAIERYYFDNGQYPANMGALLTATNGNGPYLQSIPKDGWGNAIEYAPVPSLATGATGTSTNSGYVLLSGDGSPTSSFTAATTTSPSAFITTYTGGLIYAAGGSDYVPARIGTAPVVDAKYSTTAPVSGSTSGAFVPATLQSDLASTTTVILFSPN